MRVTQSMLSNNMLKNLSSSYDRLGVLQEQMNTQKKITRPSDDPVVAMKGMTYRTSVTEIEQFKRNFSEAYNWAENSDAALDNATKALHRIRELTVQASNDTYEAGQRETVMQEIKQLKDHLFDLVNTKFGDKYLFNGTDTTTPPAQKDSNGKVTIANNNQPVELELSKGIKMQVNVNPSQAFSLGAPGTPGEGLFQDIDDLINKLEDDQSSGADINGFLAKIDTHMNNITNARADLGARLNRIELMEDRVDEQEVIAKRIMSENEDIDVEKVITDLKTQEAVHRAALSIGARIIQPTLMDFLR
ncbi:flagellar hook-associated protein FlgL [Pseudobacillus badius]|uniref:flagellar hook-associated protein FlgL n=1 Tax=Bacillus badius TaxID=1455 RepID=UPI0007B06EB2|nr:flagellar hook-associated protein FlgL [Bacillus badius]KZO00149.1 flagellar biosynthesis protein FlgL [Bacillus badius]MED0668540.1 flagellar hook-associated protein FlgL [Bacillus badius]OCS86311.1 flagellar hook-associated protein FlgL [Bacillus badius]OVE52229.1 flagellar hook-associated protein FlgL [Bacillus badius]TDW03946.1 flagellar hook-associated protein 3 FlgL [Bacillus badius]